MDNEIRNRIKEIEIEDMILGIFVLLIILSYIANQLEKNYFVNRREKDKKGYYYIQVVVFLVVVIINIYYVIISYQDVVTLSPNTSYNRRKYARLDLIAGLSALVASSIILYIAITDKDIEAEITL